MSEMTGVRLAIVGSSRFHADPLALAAAERIILAAFDRLQPDTVISGGAPGIDQLAAVLVRDHLGPTFPLIEHLPAHPRWEPDGYKARNILIATDCTHLLCIRHTASASYGSGWTADYAERLGRHVERHLLGPGGLRPDQQPASL